MLVIKGVIGPLYYVILDAIADYKIKTGVQKNINIAAGRNKIFVSSEATLESHIEKFIEDSDVVVANFEHD